MRGIRLGHRRDDEGERPFWISFADLMTALMVLFLVVMVVSLLSLNRTVDDLQSARGESEELAALYREEQRTNQERAERLQEHERLQDRFWDRLEAATDNLGVQIDRRASTISFGDRARFAFASDQLPVPDQVLIRRFASHLLDTADSDVGRRVVNRINVEGYTDLRGSYLVNLNLSSNRSQRVLCTLLGAGGAELTPRQKGQVRRLFIVGGFSSNNQRPSAAASRRVEISVDLLELDQTRAPVADQKSAIGQCPLAG